jgi:hypothetical protein
MAAQLENTKALVPVAPSLPRPQPASPWQLPPRGLSVFYGCPEMPRLFHYFLPRLIRHGKRVMCFDGGNRFDPLLIARFARRHKEDATAFQTQLRVARAFTCFQLTELLARTPRLLGSFPAEALLVTALPDLYFDEDVRDGPACASFRQALDELHRLARRLTVAVYTDATSFVTARRGFFPALLAGAGLVWKFTTQQDESLAFTCEKSSRALPAAL